MNSVAYVSPYVPPEWIAAWGLRPLRLELQPASAARGARPARGVCPYAGALIDTACGAAPPASALVLTTTCDQMRYAAAVIPRRASLPLLLLNVPSTWQTPTAGEIYRAELQRLGRFLQSLGGRAPTHDQLVETLLQYDLRRCALREEDKAASQPAQPGDDPLPGIPLALLGGPLLQPHRQLYSQIEQAGGRVVLDGMQGGIRTMPAPLVPEQARRDPLGALVAAYLDAIPDAFRRPNTALYEWLAREVPARGVRGIILWHYVWCDLWHAEAHRIKQCSGVPVLEIDAVDDASSAVARRAGQVEAFLEVLAANAALTADTAKEKQA